MAGQAAVINAYIGADFKAIGQRPKAQPGEIADHQTMAAEGASQFVGPHELAPIVGADRCPAQNIFGRQFGAKQGACGAVDGGRQKRPLRLQQAGDGGAKGVQAGDMLQHFGGDHHVKARALGGQGLGGHAAVVDGQVMEGGMGAGGVDRAAGGVDGGNRRAQAMQRLGDQAAAAADVQDARALDAVREEEVTRKQRVPFTLESMQTKVSIHIGWAFVLKRLERDVTRVGEDLAKRGDPSIAPRQTKRQERAEGDAAIKNSRGLYGGDGERATFHKETRAAPAGCRRARVIMRGGSVALCRVGGAARRGSSA